MRSLDSVSSAAHPYPTHRVTQQVLMDATKSPHPHNDISKAKSALPDVSAINNNQRDKLKNP